MPYKKATRYGLCAGILAVLAACAHDDHRLTTPQPTEHATASTTTQGPPQYLVADPTVRGGEGITLALGSPGSYGLVVDKIRVTVGRGEPRVAPDTTDDKIAGAAKIPQRFGGGFLFWTETAFYRADAFDAPLKPLARVPDAVQVISFAPKYLLARTRNGERWGIAIPSGERMPIEPLGVADVEGMDDGRALAFNDQGAAFASQDGGAHWNDITAQIKSSPTRVAVIENEIWLFESNSGAHRLEPDGHLSWFDKQPPEKPPEIRARDPRWRSQEAPLRTVFHAGAAIDDSTAIVIEDGDVVRIDVHTGEVQSVIAGKLPPESQCEAVPISGDVLFACSTRGSMGYQNGSSFVVAHTLTGDAPNVEQSFKGNGQFFAGGDGGLAYFGPCSTAPTPSSSGDERIVCVRQPSGAWEEHDISGLTTDAGSPNDVHVARWIPHADGHVVALVLDPNPALYDPRSGTLTPLPADAHDIVQESQVGSYARYRKHYAAKGGDGGLVDESWSFTPSGSIRGWQRHGVSVEIAEDGRVIRSPYAFEVINAGPYALGRTKEGRLYQSSDHGATWVEVAGPPSGAGAVDLRSCTNAGCDLGAFYRVGWAVRPPRVEQAPKPAASPPEVRRTRALELACKPNGAASSKMLPRTESSPDDLGLGAARLPVVNEKSEWAYVRNAIPRGILNPLHESSASGDGDYPAVRALFSGYQTTHDGDTVMVAGPNKTASQLRRALAFVAPFDPAGRIGRTSIAMSEVLAAGRGIGMTTDEILQEDMTESGAVIPLGSMDPNAASDIAIHNVRGLLVVVRGERTRVTMRSSQNEGNVISGAALTNDETVFLEVEGSGTGHVFKFEKIGLGRSLRPEPDGERSVLLPRKSRRDRDRPEERDRHPSHREWKRSIFDARSGAPAPPGNAATRARAVVGGEARRRSRMQGRERRLARDAPGGRAVDQGDDARAPRRGGRADDRARAMDGEAGVPRRLRGQAAEPEPAPEWPESGRADPALDVARREGVHVRARRHRRRRRVAASARVQRCPAHALKRRASQRCTARQSCGARRIT
jgi:hypothetical protein